MAEALRARRAHPAPAVAEPARRRRRRPRRAGRRARRAPRSGHRPRRNGRARAKRATGARGATLYCTLEPCNHHGPHPAVRAGRRCAAGIARVVVGDARSEPAVSRRRAASGSRPRASTMRLGRARRGGPRSGLALRRHARVRAPVRGPEDRDVARWLLRAAPDGRRAAGRPFYLTGDAARRDVHIGCGAGATWCSSARGRWPPTAPRLDGRLVQTLTTRARPRIRCRPTWTPTSASAPAGARPHRVFAGARGGRGPAAAPIDRHGGRGRAVRRTRRPRRPDGRSLARFRERGGHVLLVEGGPTLAASFLAARPGRSLGLVRRARRARLGVQLADVRAAAASFHLTRIERVGADVKAVFDRLSFDDAPRRGRRREGGALMFTGLVREIGAIRSVRRGRRRRPSLEIDAADAAPGLRHRRQRRGERHLPDGDAPSTGSRFSVDLSAETLRATTAGRWRAGDRVHLEPSLRAADALGGHFVLGHVDGVGRVVRVGATGRRAAADGRARRRGVLAQLLPKGSIAVDGVSLTLDEGPFVRLVHGHARSRETLRETRLGGARGRRRASTSRSTSWPRRPRRRCGRPLATAHGDPPHGRGPGRCDRTSGTRMAVNAETRCKHHDGTREARLDSRRAGRAAPRRTDHRRGRRGPRERGGLHRGGGEGDAGDDQLPQQARPRPDLPRGDPRAAAGARTRADGRRQHRPRSARRSPCRSTRRRGITHRHLGARPRAHGAGVPRPGDARPRDLARPGHVFPLEAQPGGVLRRAGHTEAAVDLSRMAGLVPRRRPLRDHGRRREHGAAAAPARDRRRVRPASSSRLPISSPTAAGTRRLVHREIEVDLPTRSGSFRLVAYSTTVDQAVHLALVKGTFDPGDDRSWCACTPSA